MKRLRRLADLLMTVFLIVLAAALAYLAANGRMPAIQQTTMLGFGAVIVAIVLFGAFNWLRRRDRAISKLIDNPRAVVELSSSLVERRVLAACLLLMAVGFGIAIFGGGLDTEAQVWAWAGVLLFPSISLLALLRKRLSSLRLSPDGLDFSGFQTGPIAWTDIRVATIRTMGKLKLIVLELWNEQEYLALRPKPRWPMLQRFRLVSSFAFVPPTATVSPESILKAIEIRRLEFGHSGPRRATVEQRNL